MARLVDLIDQQLHVLADLLNCLLGLLDALRFGSASLLVNPGDRVCCSLQYRANVVHAGIWLTYWDR